VQDANSYVTPAFVLAYLTERGRETENLWSTIGSTLQEAAVIAATQYIDVRWGTRFKGLRATSFTGECAIGSATFAGNPSDTETFTLGNFVYTFVAALVETNNFEVLIGATQADTMASLIAAVNGGPQNTDFSAALTANQNASALLDADDANVINFTAKNQGSSGNDIALAEATATAISAVSAATLLLGRDAGSQPLEFPRSSLFDQDGIQVIGIPRRLKEAAAEYAVRAVSAELLIDPTIDDTGVAVQRKREKVGPIEEETEYAEGATLSRLIRPYPAADRLLAPYVFPAGRAIR
jgi:hypothetical protein